MNKKKKRLLIIVVAIFSIIIGCCHIPMFSFYISYFTAFSTTSNKVEDFERYKADYVAISNEVIKMSIKQKISVNPKESFYCIYLRDTVDKQAVLEAEEHPYYGTSPNKTYHWEISEDLFNNERNIYESFPNEPGYSFTNIFYTENRVSFHSENGHYAIVYSVDDKRPKFWLLSSEEEAIKVKKITKNWYHMWR